MPACLTFRKRSPLFSRAQGWHKRRVMTGFAATLLSIAVVGSFALVVGGLYLLLKGRDRKQGTLMLIAALVLFGNVLVWTV